VTLCLRDELVPLCLRGEKIILRDHVARN
jgi:hypothetical protein